MLINGVEITDIDVCDYAVMERYEAAHDVVLEKSKQAKQVCKRRSELIKYQCEVVFEFIDTVFGEGTAKKVFGDSCNLRTALADSQKQNSGKIYPNPNYHHKKKKRR